jgi:predicted RNase H-like HicB family nuclease
MSLRLQLEYWKDGKWFVGRLPQVPGVFSQGATLEELEENVRDAYRMMQLRTAIDEGDASGIAEDGVFERVLETLNFPRELR